VTVRSPRKWLRRLFKWGLRFCLLLAALGLLLYVFRIPLFGQRLKILAQRKLGAALKADVKIAGLSGSLLFSTRLQGITISPRAGSPFARETTIRSLSLSYSPWRLLGGKGKILGEVTLKGAHLFLSTSGDSDNLSLNQRLRSILQVLNTIELWPSIVVRDVSISTGALQINDINGQLRLRDGRVHCSVKIQGPASTTSIKADLPLNHRDGKAPCSFSVFLDVPSFAALSSYWPEAKSLAACSWPGASLSFAASGTIDSVSGSGELRLLPSKHQVASKPDRASWPETRIPIILSGGKLGFPQQSFATPWGQLSLKGLLPIGHTNKASGSDQISVALEISSDSHLLTYLPQTVRDLKPAGQGRAVMRISGSLLAPQTDLQATVKKGSIVLPAPFTRITDISGQVKFIDGRYVITALQGQLGPGRMHATLSWNHGNFKGAAGSLEGRDLLLISDNELGVHLRTNCKLQLVPDKTGKSPTVLKGLVEIPMLQYYREFVSAVGTAEDSGENLAREGQHVLSDLAIKLLPSPDGGLALPGIENFKTVRLDVKVLAEGQLRLENSLVGALLTGRLKLSGNCATPALSGTVTSKGGQIRLLPGILLPLDKFSLQIPKKIGATPSIFFESRFLAGQVHIFIAVSGPISAPVLCLTSHPPYSHDDLMSILLYGSPPGSADRSGDVHAAMSKVGVLIGGYFLDRKPRAEGGDSLVDRFIVGVGPSGEGGRSFWQYHKAGTVLHVEYLLSRYLSISNEYDDQGHNNVDLNLRFVWPRPKDGPCSHPLIDSLVMRRQDRKLRRKLVRFSGNQQIGKSQLCASIASQLRAIVKGSWTPALATDAVFRLRHHYFSSGYIFAKVKGTVKAGKLYLTIDEGRRVFLGAVRFRGNKSFSNKQLNAILAREGPSLRSLPFSWRVLEAEKESVLAFYQHHGFLDVRVSETRTKYSKKDSRMKVYHYLEEGPRYRLSSITWDGVSGPELAGLNRRSARYLGKPLSSFLAKRLASSAQEDCLQQGRPATYVKYSVRKNPKTKSAQITFLVRPGPLVRIGRLQVSGNRRVRPGFIRRAAGLKSEQLITNSRMRRASGRLSSTGLFREIKILPLDIRAPQAGSTGPEVDISDLEIYIEETEPDYARLRIGYGTFDHLRLGATLGTINAFGNGESLSVGGSLTGRGFKLESDLGFFPLAGVPLKASVHAFYEDSQDVSFDLRNFGYIPALDYRFSAFDQLGLGVAFEWIRTDDVSLGVPVGDQSDFRIGVPFLRAVIDRRDFTHNPRSGFLLEGRGDYSDAEIYGDISFVRARARATGYLPLGSHLGLSSSAQCRMIRPLGATAEIPIALRIFGGGLGSVRGFEERKLGPMINDEPTGGELLVSLQTELKLKIWGELYAIAFVDVGNVYPNVDDADLEILRYGFGPGLRYYTPAGPIGLDVGHNPEPQNDEKEWVFHLIFGLNF
jgi:outer membrane protein insertion porin family